MSAQRHRWNRRKARLCAAGGIGPPAGSHCHCRPGIKGEQALATDFTRKNLPPSLAYPFGTDWMGRDMFVRSLTGLSISIRIGLLTACISAGGGFHPGNHGRLSGQGHGCWSTGGIIDLVMGIPHILLLILISFAVERDSGVY